MLENENLNEPKKPQLNIGAVSGSDLFKKYLKKDPDFNGELNFNRFDEIEGNYSVLDYFNLLAWYNNDDNSEEVGKLTANINIEHNKKEATRKASEFRAQLVKKQPSIHSWEYLGMIHEH